MEGLMGYRWLRKWQHRWVAVVGIFIFSFSPRMALADAPTEQGIRIQQEALVWTTDYEGLIDGKAGDETVRALKKYQARLGHTSTGVLSDDEVVSLIKEGFAKRDAVGFGQLTDSAAGVSLGIPQKLLPAPVEKKWGKSWYSKQNGIAIDTLRIKDTSLRELYDKLLNINNRTVAYQRFVDDNWFVIAAFEGAAAIYVRANLVRASGQPDEIRGFSIWMSETRPAYYQSIAPAMLSSFRFNTDRTRDVSTLSEGGLDSAVLKDYKKNDYGYRKLVEPPVPIVPKNEPVALSKNCFNGLGDCPISIFAFKNGPAPGTSGR
jgi:hypothetical protein